MKNLKSIKSFLFNYAQYDIADKHGNKGVLKINYKDNSYDIELGIDDSALRVEVVTVAKDLLERKHGINFANK